MKDVREFEILPQMPPMQPLPVGSVLVTEARLRMFSNVPPFEFIATEPALPAETVTEPTTVRFLTVPFMFSNMGAETVTVLPLPSRTPRNMAS